MLNNLESAAAIFSNVYQSFAEEQIPFWENFCLLNLVAIEIDSFADELIDSQAELSGQWMRTLDNHTKHNMPGIAAQSIILKAKFREKQGRHDEV